MDEKQVAYTKSSYTKLTEDRIDKIQRRYNWEIARMWFGIYKNSTTSWKWEF